MIEYKNLTPEEQTHFLQHGWIKVPKAIQPEYIQEWLSNLFIRIDYDPNDKSTWKEKYLKLPRHREIPVEELCPKAWEKILDIVGGESKVHGVRERYWGDQMIVNFGEGGLVGMEHDVRDAKGWHIDNDWYRQFLNSSGNALTIICCFTDIPKNGGGTILAEDGIKGVVEKLYKHPEGIDPPFSKDLCGHCPSECKEFVEITADAGDVFITHGMLPHAASPNHLHYARVITNPHVCLKEPFILDRSDGDYTLCEQVILKNLGKSSIPSSEYSPLRENITFYPGTAYFKRQKIKLELQRILEHARSQGLGPHSVDSIYLKGPEVIKEHERRNGYDLGWGPGGVQLEERAHHGWCVPLEDKHIVI